MTYDAEDGLLIDGVTLATKLHVGWRRVLEHDWGRDAPASVPDVSHMTWADALPAELYRLDPSRPLPQPTANRACPGCYCGDYDPPRLRDAG